MRADHTAEAEARLREATPCELAGIGGGMASLYEPGERPDTGFNDGDDWGHFHWGTVTYTTTGYVIRFS